MSKDRQPTKKDSLLNLSNIEEENLKQIISELLAEKRNNLKIDIEKHNEILKKNVKNYQKKTTFKVGDLVMWKKGLKNKKFPQYEEPCIVIEILDKPIFDESVSISTPYFNEKLDIKLGILSAEEEFLSFLFDRNRFELFKK